jgi:hypothetical protein
MPAPRASRRVSSKWHTTQQLASLFTILDSGSIKDARGPKGPLFCGRVKLTGLGGFLAGFSILPKNSAKFLQWIEK